MNDTQATEKEWTPPGKDEMLTALFAQMVIQQANMAMMLLGKAPHPQTGKMMQDLEGARMFIDQLEMIEAKTKGNLSKEEQTLLKQSLMSLHLAFVEASESTPPSQPDSTLPAPAPAAEPAGESAPSSSRLEPSGPEAESRKKFTKKY